jgi:hypothetical protein
MATNDVGRTPNNSLFHAEATILIRAARESGGTLAGQTLEVSLNNEICGNCRSVLPLLGIELGNPTVVFSNKRTGSMWLLQNGTIRSIK